MNFDKAFFILASIFLLVTAVARTLKNAYEKKITGRLGIIMSLTVNVVGGVMLGLLVSIYTNEPKWQMLATSIGAWSGERSLDFITDIIEERFNFKNTKNENDK